MNGRNKNNRNQRNARSALFKAKADTTSTQVPAFSQKYFEIPIPEAPKTTLLNNTPHLTRSPEPFSSSFSLTPLDPRREHIKQKIKFRVKQQLWNLLKKNAEKSSPTKAVEEVPVRSTKGSPVRDCLVGRSFPCFRRQSSPSRGRQSPVGERRPVTAQVGRWRGSRRSMVWSTVKMREVDRIQMQKKVRLNKSAMCLQKLDSFQLQPWKGGQDPQHEMS